jgi:hypothetical protein
LLEENIFCESSENRSQRKLPNMPERTKKCAKILLLPEQRTARESSGQSNRKKNGKQQHVQGEAA